MSGVPYMEKAEFNEELIEALEESEQIIKEIKEGKRKGYSSMEDLINSLNDE